MKYGNQHLLYNVEGEINTHLKELKCEVNKREEKSKKGPMVYQRHLL